MNVKDAIKKRSSIRKFKPNPVSPLKIKALLEAARHAPSGNNAQPWKFFPVKEAKTRKKISKYFPQDFVCKAPVVLVCAADPKAYSKEKFLKGFDDPSAARALRDLGIAAGFITLRATELGLGSCIVGWFKKEQLKKALKIPERFLVPFVIVVGQAAEKPKLQKRKSLKQIMF